MKKNTKIIKEITIEKDIQAKFELMHGLIRPNTIKREDGTYSISVDKYSFRTPPKGVFAWEYFELDKNGIITEAPRGYAREFKGCKVKDINKWVKKYK